MKKDLQDFEQFMKRREEASLSYIQGDANPFNRMVTQIFPATFFSPRGGYRRGTSEVAAGYERDAALFEPESESSSFEILQMGASDGVGYWTGIQRARVRMRGSLETFPMELRVTEVFRLEVDGWKIVHRHADTLVDRHLPP